MATVENEGASLYYETHGEGPAVVFAHGRGGNCASWWQQVPAFAKHFKVVVFDHRGFGRSRCDNDHFEAEYFPRDIAAILDAEGIEKAGMVCQSMGGWGGLKLAVTQPERVAALVLANTPGGLDTPKANAAIAHIASGAIPPGTGQIGKSFVAANPEGTYLARQISGLNCNFPRSFNRLTSAKAVSQQDLEGYAVPTLAITSPEDVLFPPEVMEEVAASIPDARLEVIPGVGHSTYFEAPEIFNALVLGFLKGALFN
ncbi:alpha/beta fold hydrolase [Pelagibius marinus]|uniref:alpha/beta fold hydrolase n=1 Tax=Pelagibius marinus TaxID=2762760 RepID=UPI0018733D8F|nr:alpha/beta fold hydrolase [Pelagibius marinus]